MLNDQVATRTQTVDKRIFPHPDKQVCITQPPDSITGVSYSAESYLGVKGIHHAPLEPETA
jgi:hypothetical protein